MKNFFEAGKWKIVQLASFSLESWNKQVEKLSLLLISTVQLNDIFLTGVHFAGVHDEEVRGPTDPDVPGLPLPHALRLHQDLGEFRISLAALNDLEGK